MTYGILTDRAGFLATLQQLGIRMETDDRDKLRKALPADLVARREEHKCEQRRRARQRSKYDPAFNRKGAALEREVEQHEMLHDRPKIVAMLKRLATRLPRRADVTVEVDFTARYPLSIRWTPQRAGGPRGSMQMHYRPEWMETPQ